MKFIEIKAIFILFITLHTHVVYLSERKHSKIKGDNDKLEKEMQREAKNMIKNDFHKILLKHDVDKVLKKHHEQFDSVKKAFNIPTPYLENLGHHINNGFEKLKSKLNENCQEELKKIFGENDPEKLKDTIKQLDTTTLQTKIDLFFYDLYEGDRRIEFCSKEIKDIIINEYTSKMNWRNFEKDKKINEQKFEEQIIVPEQEIPKEAQDLPKPEDKGFFANQQDKLNNFVKNHPKKIGMIYMVLKLLSAFLDGKKGLLAKLKQAIDYILTGESVIMGCASAILTIWPMIEKAWEMLFPKEKTPEEIKEEKNREAEAITKMRELLRIFYENSESEFKIVTSNYQIKDYCLELDKRFDRIKKGEQNSEKYNLFKYTTEEDVENFKNKFGPNMQEMPTKIMKSLINQKRSDKPNFLKSDDQYSYTAQAGSKAWGLASAAGNMIFHPFTSASSLYEYYQNSDDDRFRMPNNLFDRKQLIGIVYDKKTNAPVELSLIEIDNMIMYEIILKFDWDIFTIKSLKFFHEEIRKKGIGYRICNYGFNLTKKVICQEYFKKEYFDDFTDRDRINYDKVISIKILQKQSEIIHKSNEYFENMKEIFANEEVCTNIVEVEKTGIIKKLVNFISKLTEVLSNLASALMSCICPLKSFYQTLRNDYDNYKKRKAEEKRLKDEQEEIRLQEEAKRIKDAEEREKFKKIHEEAKKIEEEQLKKLNGDFEKLEKENITDKKELEQKQAEIFKENVEKILEQNGEIEEKSLVDDLKNGKSVMDFGDDDIENDPNLNRKNTHKIIDDEKEIAQQKEIKSEAEHKYLEKGDRASLEKLLIEKGYNEKERGEIIANKEKFFNFNTEYSDGLKRMLKGDEKLLGMIKQGVQDRAERQQEWINQASDPEEQQYRLFKVANEDFDLFNESGRIVKKNLIEAGKEVVDYCKKHPFRCTATAVKVGGLAVACPACAAGYVARKAIPVVIKVGKNSLVDVAAIGSDRRNEYENKESDWAHQNPAEAKFKDDMHNHMKDGVKSVVNGDSLDKAATEAYIKTAGSAGTYIGVKTGLIEPETDSKKFRFKSESSRRFNSRSHFKALNNKKNPEIKKTVNTVRVASKISKINKDKQLGAKIVNLIYKNYISKKYAHIVKTFGSVYYGWAQSSAINFQLHTIGQNVVSTVKTLFGDFITSLIYNFVESFVSDAYLIWWRIGKESYNILSKVMSLRTQWNEAQKLSQANTQANGHRQSTNTENTTTSSSSENSGLTDKQRDRLIWESSLVFLQANTQANGQGQSTNTKDTTPNITSKVFDFFAPEDYGTIKSRYGDVADIIISFLKIFKIYKGTEKVERPEEATFANSAFGKCFNLKGKTSQGKRKFKFAKKLK